MFILKNYQIKIKKTFSFLHGDSGILENFYRAYAGRISEFGADINIFMMARPRYKSLNGNKSNGSHARKSRYSIANINRIAEVIQNLKNYYNSEKVILVGYSGGAGIAMYLGSIDNKSIKSIRTIAGNINHNELSKILKISRLKKSINFYSIEKKINTIPQVHYYGLKDKIVPNELQTSYKIRNSNNKCIKIKPVNKATHNEGWVDFWINNNNNIPNCFN